MKRYILVLFYISTILFCCIGCSDKEDIPCEWCGNTPSVCIEKENGEYCYICEKCSGYCIYCGEKATRHYSSPNGHEVFVCDECYEIDLQMMKENGMIQEGENNGK